MNLLQLPWEDVICKNILPFMSLTYVYRLKRVSKTTGKIVTMYLKKYLTCMDFDLVYKHKEIPNELFWEILRENENVISLKFDYCNNFIREKELCSAICKNPRMKRLNFQGTSIVSSQIFQCVGENLHDLQYINLAYCKKLGTKEISLIGKNCHALRSVNINGCISIEDNAIITIVENNPMLQQLCLASCSLLTKSAFLAIGRCCRFLSHIYFADCNVDDAGLTLIFRNNPNLKHVDLSVCNQLTKEVFHSLGTFDRDLRSFYPSPNVEDAGFFLRKIKIWRNLGFVGI